MTSAAFPPDPAAPTSFPAADLERRFYAFTIDRLLAWTLYALAGVLAWRLLFDQGRVGAGIGLVAGVVVVTGVVTSVLLGLLGTSAGKAAVGLRVVDAATGTPIGVGRALLRSLVLGAAAIPTAGIGVATLAWTAVMDVDRERRGGHDHLVDSVVIDIRPPAVEEQDAPEKPRHIVNLTAMRLVPASPTPPREIPARALRSRWAEEQAVAPEPAVDTEAASGPRSRPMPEPAASTPAPTLAPAARESEVGDDPDALAMPAHVAPERRTSPAGGPAGDRLADPLADPLSDALVAPAAPGVLSGADPPVPASRPSTPSVPAVRPVWSVAFDTGQEFRVDGFTLVGRKPEPRSGEPVKRLVALPSPDMSLSKTHAQFQVVPDGALVVMDRGSTNGSILIRGGVSKELRPGRPATLRDGDRVRFGDREMRVTRIS